MDLKYYSAFAAYPGKCLKFQQEWKDGTGMDWSSWKDVEAESMKLAARAKEAATEHEAAMDEYFDVMKEADDICAKVPFCMT